jgi:HEAT repeat protein
MFSLREPDVVELKRKGKVRALIWALRYTTNTPAEHRKPWMIRSWAVEAPAEIGDRRALKPLMAVLSDDSEDDYVRARASTALSEFGDASAIPVLVDALSTAGVRKEAAESLRELGSRPKHDATAAKYWAGLGEWEECVELGDLAIAPLIDSLETDSVGATRARRMIGESAVGAPPPTEHLKSCGPTVRSPFLSTISIFGHQETLPSRTRSRREPTLSRTTSCRSIPSFGNATGALATLSTKPTCSSAS